MSRYKNQFLRFCWVFILFLLSIWAISGYAHSFYQTGLTDGDRREILSVLFERELASSGNKGEILILLSPRTNARWILEIPGIRFKHLAYEEERQVSEYYEIRDSDTGSDQIKVELEKGNYCKKVGARYQFRKEQGRWRARISEQSESFTTGTTCPGCKPGSGSVYRPDFRTAAAAKNIAEDQAKPKSLILNGRALDIRCARNEHKYIVCEADMRLEFFNQSDEPIIILKPFREYSFWHGASTLALTKTDSEARNYVYSRAAWPSIYTFPIYGQLAERLDQPTPPAALTRVIKPGESWEWETTISFWVAEENSCDGSIGVEIGWKEIKKLSSTLWLQISYEMWPFNVENFKEDLGGRLRERWKQYGVLYLEEKSDRYWFAHITSEPIELDLRAAELK